MNNAVTPSTTYVNMSAYVALSCLIAFVVVITICLVKQFIWDPLLAKRFEVIRPVLSESVRKLSTSFYRPHSTMIIQKSMSDSGMQSNESPLIPNKNFLPSSANNTSLAEKNFSRRSYGSSTLNSYAYTNYGSEDLYDEHPISHPLIHFSCEYNPSTFSIRLNIQNLRNMNALLPVFPMLTDRSAYIFVRFLITSVNPVETYETSLKHFQDFIRFGETFNILSNIRAGEPLNHQIEFFLILLHEQNFYPLGEMIYPFKDDQIIHLLFLERILPMSREEQLNTTDEHH